MKEIGLYIHIPFCKQKCYYCDFCSYANKHELQEKYIEAVIKELNSITKKEVYVIKTIYIGGGTPSIINPNLIQKLVHRIYSLFHISKDAEITIEVNPGTVDENKISIYKECGINRISMGLQSSNDKLLKEIGRIHSYQDFEKAYDIIKKYQLNNVNIDLMIGLPNQTIKDVENTIKKIIEKNPCHISVYSLIIEPGTIMEKLISSKKLILPNEETERLMYWGVKKILEENGYNQYEISNFSKKGFESKHNLDCWNQKEYIGLGAAAHSYLNYTRYSNICEVEEYIKNIESNNFEKNIIIHEQQEKKDAMKEFMIIGLRKIEGINVLDFKEKFGQNPLQIYEKELSKMIKLQFIEVDDRIIKLTHRGVDFANIVWEEFI